MEQITREKTNVVSGGEDQASIVIHDLHKAFGEQVVLNGINFRVEHGETLVVLGRSGTGKSVLLKLMIGLQMPDSGFIQIAGQKIGEADEVQLNQLRKRMGFLFQHAALYDSLTVQENIAFPLARHSDLSPEERKNRAKELLASVGMEKDLDKMPSEISGGMQKRVGLARAMALDPEILLFDEPTAGLDPITSAEIGKLIVEHRDQRGVTSVVVTHDVRGAKVFSDHFLVIDKGNVLIEGAFADLQKSDDPVVSQFAGKDS